MGPGTAFHTVKIRLAWHTPLIWEVHNFLPRFCPVPSAALRGTAAPPTLPEWTGIHPQPDRILSILFRLCSNNHSYRCADSPLLSRVHATVTSVLDANFRKASLPISSIADYQNTMPASPSYSPNRAIIRVHLLVVLLLAWALPAPGLTCNSEHVRRKGRKPRPRKPRGPARLAERSRRPCCYALVHSFLHHLPLLFLHPPRPPHTLHHPKPPSKCSAHLRRTPGGWAHAA